MSAFATDNSGVTSFLFGVSILLLVAIGGSLALEGNLGVQGKITKVDRMTSLIEGRSKLRDLRANVAKLEVQKLQEKRFDDSRSKLVTLQGTLKEREALRERLSLESQGLENEVEQLQQDWMTYRTDRRKDLRQRMAGTIFPRFTTARKKTYRDVQVVRADVKGITIKHQGGTARIHVSDLPEKLRDSLDLDLDESLAAIAAEKKEQEKRARSIEIAAYNKDKARKRAASPVSNPVLAARKLSDLKLRITELTKRMKSAQSAASRARVNNITSSNQSVPGKLETWKSRAERMDGLASKYRSQITRAHVKVRRLEASIAVTPKN